MPSKLGLALWGTAPVPVLAAQARLAEDAGFESVWVIDSQLLCRDVFLTLAACLAATATLKVATGVTNPSTRHVSAAAGALATLAELYPGRVMAGVGTGFSSLRTIGLGAAKLSELEAFTRDLRVLLGGGTVTFSQGVIGGVDWLSDHDAPAVPVLIAASGPRTSRLAGRIADGAILLQGVAPDLVARSLEWVAMGNRDRSDALPLPEVTCWVPLAVGATRAEGYDRVRGRVASALMQGRLDTYRDEDRDHIAALRATYDNFAHASETPRHAAHVPDHLVQRYAAAGDPAEVRDCLNALSETPGVNRIVLTAHGSGVPLEDTLRLLAKSVLPALV